MAISYHISPNGPRMCRAKKGLCPYAKAGAPHFQDSAQAQAVYEKQMVANFGLTREIFKKEKNRGIGGKINREREYIYQDIDNIRALSRKVTDMASSVKNIAIATASRDARASYKRYLLGDIPKRVESFKRNNLTLKKKMLQFVAKSSIKLNERAERILEAKYTTKKYRNLGSNRLYGNDFSINKPKATSNTF